ncbi:MAG TPA: cation diffusion facilitator family transporter [Phycisphaerae bacterium]|nr:cation diffusion facilitator family transporter [Phycisphaerae bacterium]
MAHEHSHPDASPKRLALALLLTLLFVAGEITAGLFAHSLALLSDAGHNFADAAALAFSCYALYISKKPPRHGYTFGYHRVGILAALANALSLVLAALFIAWQALHRLSHPQPVDGWIVIAVAAAAICLNAFIALALRPGSHDNLNLRSAFLHMLGDALCALAVVVAGILVLGTGWQLADPLISLLVAAFILASSWSILRKSVNVLLEATPDGLDLVQVTRTITSIPGVLSAHDLHVWTVGPGQIACALHIRVADQSIREGQRILEQVARALDTRHHINHTTIQIESAPHQPAQH